jgi:hypothetical protein
MKSETYIPEETYPDVDFPVMVDCNPAIVTYPSGKTYACAGSTIMRVPTGTTLDELSRWVKWKRVKLDIETARVKGSRGNSYTVTKDNNTGKTSCSCPGNKYRGKCKHTKLAFSSCDIS